MITSDRKMIEDEKIDMLRALMESIRGSWSEPDDRIAMIKKLCDEITGLPEDLLAAIKHNAEEFDGGFNDGRIFRDGQLFLPEGTVESMGLPDEMKDGVSGNMAKMLGATSTPQVGGWYGTYGEISQITKRQLTVKDKSAEFLQMVEDLFPYPECTFDDYGC